MGGEVTALSRLGEGSVFTLSIPIVYPQCAMPDTGNGPAAAPDLPSRRARLA